MRGIYPYATVGSELTLRPVKVVMDAAREVDVGAAFDTRTIDLSAIGDRWSELSCELEVFLPRDLPADFADPRVTAVLACGPSNLRIAQPLHRSEIDPTRWAGQVVLNRDACAQRASLRALLTGTVGDAPHRVLGESDEWLVQVDEPAVSPITGAIRVKWLRFDDPGVEPKILNRFASEAFYISVDESAPTLFLNKAFPNLPGLLVDRRRTGAAAAIHDTTRSAIAAKAWIAMFNAAAAEIFQSDPDEPPALPDGWRGQVLRKLLATIYELSDIDEALRRLRDSWQAEAGSSVQPLVVVAVEQHVGSGKLLRRAMSALSAVELAVPPDSTVEEPVT